MSSTIWLLDRSRVVDGRGFCQRARLLGYHIGPNGYGITMKATKLPLMTGIAGHDGLAPILEWCRQHPTHITIPPDAIIRAAIHEAQQKYWKTVEVRGFAYLSDNEDVQAVTREQNYLISGMIWAWCIEVLPEILQRAQILEVEVDDTYVFDCTCGLGDGIGTKADHEARDCQGKGLMCRPDFLALTRLTQELEYHEFKTTSMDSITFRDKWEVMIQMFAATLDAERRLQRQVQSIYIHGLIKGKREGDYNSESGKRDSYIRQNSVFCYGYRKPGNPPMEQEEWAAQYEYYEPYEGKTKRLPRSFKKAGVWEIPETLMATPESDGPDPEMTRSEFWVKWIPTEARKKTIVLMGPFTRQQQMVEHFLQEAKGEEDRWQDGLWQLYDLGVKILEEYSRQAPAIQDAAQGDGWWSVVWPDPRFQFLMDRLFPRSYECRRYGMRNRCVFEDPCLYREGWADPIGSGRYIERRPHHKDELDQAIGRGLMLPDEGAGEDVDWEIG